MLYLDKYTTCTTFGGVYSAVQAMISQTFELDRAVGSVEISGRATRLAAMVLLFSFMRNQTLSCDSTLLT